MHIDRISQASQLQSGSIDWLLGYDQVDDVLAISNQLDTQNSQLFIYDNLYRLDSS